MPNWLGDAVMAIPTLAGIRAVRPGAEMHVLTRPSLASLYRLVPDVAGIVETRSRGLFDWRDESRALAAHDFAAALILPRSFRSSLLPWAAKIPERIGYGSGGRGFFLTRSLLREPRLLRGHRVHYYRHLLSAWGDPPPAAAPCIPVPAAARAWAEALPVPAGRVRVAVNPGATYGTAKQWYPERFIALGRRLVRERNAHILVVGGPDGRDLGARIRDGIGATDAMSLAGGTDLPQLAAALASCRLLVTNDTGPMHVAAAVGTPVVAVYGPTDPVTTPPYGEGHAIVRHPVECSPCLLRTCPIDHRCMAGIGVEEVFRSCVNSLDRSPSKDSAAGGKSQQPNPKSQ